MNNKYRDISQAKPVQTLTEISDNSLRILECNGLGRGLVGGGIFFSFVLKFCSILYNATEISVI